MFKGLQKFVRALAFLLILFLLAADRRLLVGPKGPTPDEFPWRGASHVG